MRFQFLPSISQIPARQWHQLLASDYPFLQHHFLLALEQSGCVGEGTGWLPRYLWVEQNGQPVAAAPLFTKTDSWGEYVFDWAWADAFRRAGRAYYPKLVCAVPFTPATGPRLLGDPALLAELQPALEQWALEQGFSSLHWLFPDAQSSARLSPRWQQRHATQFHWFNQGFSRFEDFLARFNARKRKGLLRERRRVAEAGIRLERKSGQAISHGDWDHFYRCYQHTYQKRSGHGGYLNRNFFAHLGEQMADQVMMVVALRDRGIDVKYLVAENEGHGFSNADNRMALYRSMEMFFSECLGGRVQQEVPAFIDSKIAELTVNVQDVSVPDEAGR